MTASKADVLAWAELNPSLMANLRRDYTVHLRNEITDLASWGETHGSKIKAVITSGAIGTEIEVLDHLPNLQVVNSFGVGYDPIDIDYLAKRGIPVSNTPDVLNNAVAETAMALMLGLTRRIPEADRFVRKGAWPTGKFPLGRQLTGKTCGIVGLGKIGKTIAKRAEAFEMKIAYYRRGEAYSDVSYTHYSDLAELAKVCDYLVLIVPGGAQTQHLVNREILQALGKDSYLVNVARGSVVDEKALIAALQAGEIAGAALDVFEDEPNVPEAFYAMDNVVLAPHIGSGTHETRQAMADLVFANVQQFFADGTLITPVQA
jgi:lactate dehydrogenase-like 2-hydroxyacid dehydrogenase